MKDEKKSFVLENCVKLIFSCKLIDTVYTNQDP